MERNPSRSNLASSCDVTLQTGADEDDHHTEDTFYHTDFKERVQNAIGSSIDFSHLTFPAKQENVSYDDLPTFPVRPNFASFRNSLRPASECVVFDGCPEDPYHPSNTPIYQTSTFVQPSCSEFGAYDYTRSGNPTRTALEKHVALLEQAAAAFAFASGMAALHTVMRLLKAGDEVLVNEDIYGGMHRLLVQDCVHSGVKVTFVDTTDLEAVKRAITPQTRLVHTESPSNPRMRITDLRALASLAHARGALLCVDSTMMPPVICKPLTLGADIVVHSATKFFSGHADCTGGLVCVREPGLAHRVAFLQNAEGTALAPFECFLFLRGIKTMHLRVERAQENAEQVSSFLRAHPKVKDMFFPGRGGCDARSLAIHKSQANGQGSMLSFTTGSTEFSRRFCNSCRIFKTTVSFGSVNSLCEMPFTMSHASIPAEQRTLPEDLVRLSVGVEDARDLIADLAHALRVAAGDLPSSASDMQGYDSRFEDLPVVPAPAAAAVSPPLGPRPAPGISPLGGPAAAPLLAAAAPLVLPGSGKDEEEKDLTSTSASRSTPSQTSTSAPSDVAHRRRSPSTSSPALVGAALLGAGAALLISRFSRAMP